MYIELKDAVKQYGSGESTVFALNHADFAVEEGQICVVLGPSGSGKSTLLNILGGLSSLDGGRLKVGEKMVSDFEKKKLTDYRRDDIGFVFQFYNLIPDLTVQENIEVAADLSDTPLPVDDLLAALDMEKYRYRFPRELSGGQQQRTAIARAMVKNPKLLLCDELTGALDTKASKAVLEYIGKMNSQFGTTVIIITHNEAIAGMADVIVRLRDGAVVSSGVNYNKISASELIL